MLTFVPRVASVLALSVAVWMGEYLPAHGPSYWTYEARGHPSDTYTDAVFDTASCGGVFGVKFGEPDDYTVIANTGRVVTAPCACEDGFVIDFDPDLVLGWIEDGAPFVLCYGGDCDTSLIRDWDTIDPALRAIYELDPIWDDLWLFASLDRDHPPNFQNVVVTSNLPPEAIVPAGAVTGLEWYQRGVGMIANVDIEAASGGMEVFYDLVFHSIGVDDGATPAAIALAAASPNPFNARTTLSFTLARADRVHLIVFDARGRHVTTLIAEERPPGHHEVTFDGRDDRGRALASGVYFVRLRVGEESQVQKVTLVQ